ncbi:MAG: phasin [Brevundimonas sp.]|uniref:phasin family protein n=1 Tax=Brevundimonas sp. TaxID=1871086 RepID=UPI002624E6D4|nr:phasin family protein [Brevundimonas sp.]MDI6624152.1 phasin [Brevundimonas sp.]MDQ7812924.1 phasin [Brevundimonas sp.]
MTQFDKALKTGRRLNRDGARATRTALSGGEMLQAAGDVINARLEIMAAGLADPRKIDLTEMSLMSTEKVEALSASASAMAKTFGDIGGRLGSGVMTEAGLASKAVSAMAAAGTPAAAMQAQYSYAVGWWSRAASQMLTLNSELLKGQAEALRPIHATAVANAKRLKK